MRKGELLDQLKNDIFCRLAPSEHGVGVAAIKKIPKGTDPFKGCMPGCRFIAVPKHEIDELKDEEVKKLVVDFCPLQASKYYLPSTGLMAVDISYYLNHSKKPNMITEDEGETFITKREVKKGEFLTVDYNTYDDAVDDFKN